MNREKFVGLAGSAILFAVMLILPAPSQMSVEAWRMVAITVLVAALWITDAIEYGITALLPIALLPIMGISPASQVTLSYANESIYLFLGGFMIAIAMERSNLHRRFAVYTIKCIGSSPSRMILGFMVAVYVLSMWVNNTATVLMMVPICTAIISRIDTADNDSGKYTPFTKALLLSIAYSASIGGVATLIGTPPNIILASIMSQSADIDITFFNWMKFALPVSAVMLVLAWLLLTKLLYKVDRFTLPIGKVFIANEMKSLGEMTTHEKRMLVVFGCVATLWIVRGIIDIPLFHKISDTTVAIAGVISLFVVPSGDKDGKALLDWQSAVKIPWNILLLFGGGLAISRGFIDSGLTEYLNDTMSSLKGISPWILVGLIVAIVIFLTEVMSNTATATLLIPITISVATAIGLPPTVLVVPVTIASSFAFMLPVSTPPNAIVMNYGSLRIVDMARSGILLNLAAVVILTVSAILFLPLLGWS